VRVPLRALILAAGEGTRLRPLTDHLPKALAPVGNVPLLDRALRRLADNGLEGPDQVAVNVCYFADQIARHVHDRAHLSYEPAALGTSGAVAHLRGWIGGVGLLVGNADAYLSPRAPGGADLAALLDGWDATTVRVLVVPAGDRPPEFGDSLRFAGFSLIPPDIIAGLPTGRSHLVLTAWRPAERAGRLETITYDGTYLDTGTPADYLAANLDAAGDGSLVAADAVVTGQVERAVVGSGAMVEGAVRRGVVLPRSRVGPREELVDAIRLGDDLTISVGSEPTEGSLT
jgi:NDP-sugar pyrophosphorylase family protein